METVERWAGIIDRASVHMSEEWRSIFKEIIRRVVAEEREACAQSLDAIVAQHRSRQHEFTEARFTMSGDPVPQTCAAGAFCEDFGCHSFIDAAAAIRARA